MKDGGIAHELPDGLSGRGGDVVLGEDAQPLVAGLGGEGFFISGVERVGVVTAVRTRSRSGVLGQVGPAQRRAELDPEGLVAAGEEEPLAVAGLVEPVVGVSR